MRLLITVESGDLWWETSELGNVSRANFDHVLIDIFNVKLFYLDFVKKVKCMMPSDDVTQLRKIGITSCQQRLCLR